MSKTADLLLRRGTHADIRACHDLLWASVTDFATRNGTPLEGTAAEWWLTGEPVHRFLAAHAAEWWVAEDAGSGEIVGYARSIDRSGLLELTEFFVRPGCQSAGVGGRLIDLAFPAGRGEARSIVATADVRALARYYRAGTTARFAILTLGGTPRPTEPDSRLAPVRLAAGEDLGEVVEIERRVLDYARGEAELRWLISNREGYLYRRDGRGVAIAFVGADGSGPVAALEPSDLPDVLLHLEGRAAALGAARLDLEVPSLNAVAIRHLLGRRFRLNPWINYLMADRPFGRFDRYVCFSPPIFL